MVEHPEGTIIVPCIVVNVSLEQQGVLVLQDEVV
jgi:hypothetical protein